MTTAIPQALHEMALVVGLGFPAIVLLVLAMFFRGGGGRWSR
jgi:hypothetical protein